MAWAADTLDVLTEAEAKAAVRVQGSAVDGRLDLVNTAVARRLDKLVGPIVQRAVTGERHNGGDPWVELRQRPALVAGITVTEYQGTTAKTLTAETAGTTPTDGFYPEPWDGHDPDGALTSGYLWRRVSGHDARFYAGSGNIVVGYTAGRYARTAAVDERFKAAARLMLANLWRSEDPTVAQVDGYDLPGRNWPTYAVPRAVLELLRDDVIEVPL